MENKAKMKKRGRFNIIDFLLIIFILLIIGASVLILDPFSIFSGETIEKKTIEYTVEFNNVGKDFANAFKVGNDVIATNGNVSLGTINEVNSDNDAYIWVKGENGTMKKVSDSTKKLIIIKLESSVDYNVGKGYFINSNQIAIGGEIDLKYPVDIVGECIAINIK